MEALWPHAAPDAARRNLRYTLHLLRRLLDNPEAESSAVRDDDGVLTLQSWPPGTALWLDADRFGGGGDNCRWWVVTPPLPRRAGALRRRVSAGRPLRRTGRRPAATRCVARHDLLMHLAALRAEAGDTAEAERCLRAVLARIVSTKRRRSG